MQIGKLPTHSAISAEHTGISFQTTSTKNRDINAQISMLIIPAFQKWSDTFMLNFSHVCKAHFFYCLQSVLIDKIS